MANENFWARNVAQVVESLPGMHKALGSVPCTDTLGVEVFIYNPTRGHPQLHTEF